MAAKKAPTQRRVRNPNPDREKGREIGARLQQARLHVGMTQRELGELLKPPVVERSIQAYEQGEVIPHRYIASQLPELLGRPAAWFYEGDAVFDVRDEQFTEILQRLGKIERQLARLAAAK